VGLNLRGLFLLSLVFFVLVSVASFLAPWIAPESPSQIDESMILEPPGLSHWMGTDELGRDLFARTLFGARVSLVVGMVTAFFAMVVGGV